MSVRECAIPFYTKGLSANDMLGSVDYMFVQDVQVHTLGLLTRLIMSGVFLSTDFNMKEIS